MNIANLLRRSAIDHSDRIALRHEQREVTYAEMLAQARSVAAELRQRGVQPGDRVAIWMPNRLEFLAVVLGIWHAGGVVVPINYLSGGEQVTQILADSSAVLAFVQSSDTERFGSFAQLEIITLPQDYEDTWAGSRSDAPDVIEPRFDGDDALVMYTSGSTGRSKGVRQTHRNVAAEINALADTLQITSDDHALNTMALFHVSGLQFGTLPILLRGGSITLLTKWSAEHWIELVQTTRPTMSTLITTMLIDVGNLTAAAPVSLPSLRTTMFGGSRTPAVAIERFRAGVGIDPIEIYGTTETNGISITYGPDDERREGAAGRPIRQVVEVRLVDPVTGVDVPLGDAGELWIRGDTITPGYWGRPEATAEKFRDGWLRSGDLMRADEDGYFYYIDRLDDMIVSGGENVYPQTVEGFLAICPDVAEVIVIGTPHERWVQQVTAVVVPSHEGVTADDVLAFCHSDPNLTGMNRPKRVEIVGELPRNGSGKFDRPAVRRLFAR